MEPFDGDPYDLPGWPRALVKQCILIALNAKTKDSRAVLKAVREAPDLKPHYATLLNKGYDRLKADFAAAHPAIAKYLHADVGIKLQRQDSEIAIKVIEKMMALPSFLPQVVGKFAPPVLPVRPELRPR